MRISILGTAVLMAGHALAEPQSCPGGQVTADAPGAALRDRICRVAEAGIASMAACNVVLDRPVRISVVPSLEPGCLGAFHCGEDRIDILSPEAFGAAASGEGAFSGVGEDSHYDSVIIHELAHAAYDTVPCAAGTCTATAEYIAYAMQVRTLSPADRDRVARSSASSETVSRYDISAVMLAMAPDRFAGLAWRHFSERPDPCGYMAAIMAGDIVFDRERP